ncbi:multidrug efflux SMR transporter [Bacillus sp. JJ1566]|uniref:DMT family transporter n=1 Tax=Bacillus sp. JJ1566 TaxID=3122961 RepID=UPI002FFDB609
MNAYILLILAIISEVFGSSMLKATDGFKKFLPSLGVMVGYGLAFYALSQTLKTLPLGLSYAIWSGVGTALTALVGIIVYKENVDMKKILGFLMIIGGVILLNVGGVHE